MFVGRTDVRVASQTNEPDSGQLSSVRLTMMHDGREEKVRLATI